MSGITRLLINGDWFEAVSPAAIYEDDFERIILTNSRFLYPKHIPVNFKMIVQSDSDAASADMALIDPQYRSWWVVEVEMANHSLENHVLPQVETLKNAKYGAEEARFLASQNSLLEQSKVADMMKGSHPNVLVVVNGANNGWKESLAKHDIYLQIVELFRSSHNQHILQVTGDVPNILDINQLTMCKPDKALPRMLLIDSPAALGISNGEKIGIYYENGLTEWARIDAGDKVWLNPVRRSPLSSNGQFRIVRREDGNLHFEQIGET